MNNVKIGMISFAHGHAVSYAGCINKLPGAGIAWIYDEMPERARVMAETFNAPVLDDLAGLADSDCVAVVICSENINHLKFVELAAKAGKDILCEKPLATCSEDAGAMVKICVENNVRLMTAFPCRFHPAFKRLKNMVDTGLLGDVLAIKATNQGMCPWGWFVDKKLAGGGAVTDHTVHVLDLIRCLTGQEADSVYAEVDNSMFGKDFDDTGIVNVTMENGIFATIDCSWTRPKTNPIWGNVKLEVTGTKGVCSVDLLNQKADVFSDTTNRHYYEYWGDDMDYIMLREFTQCLETGSPFPVTGVDGARAVEVVEAAYESSRNTDTTRVVHSEY